MKQEKPTTPNVKVDELEKISVDFNKAKLEREHVTLNLDRIEGARRNIELLLKLPKIGGFKIEERIENNLQVLDSINK